MIARSNSAIPSSPYVFVADTRSDSETSVARGWIRGGWYQRTSGRKRVGRTPEMGKEYVTSTIQDRSERRGEERRVVFLALTSAGEGKPRNIRSTVAESRSTSRVSFARKLVLTPSIAVTVPSKGAEEVV